jgi:O-methyltransferase involved in polyketide biosynthesis
MAAKDTSRISPTAHYTAYAWYRHGMSVPELATTKGRVLFHALAPANRLFSLAGKADLESMLLARHRVIDHLLGQAIRSGEVQQVVEVAAGLSPRGLRIRRRFPNISYVEADLAGMIASKRARIGHKLDERHSLVVVNALAESGPESLQHLATQLHPTKGTAVITEGLLPYFDRHDGFLIWNNIKAFLSTFPSGLYLSDYYLEEDSMRVLGARQLSTVLSWFVGGRTHFPFSDDRSLVSALQETGFEDAAIHIAGDYARELSIERPQRSGFVRVIEARTKTA